jgi:D-amino-acid dehydrogenase
MMKIVVIGAGIVGSSTAYHLVKKGVEVVLIDKFHKGQATAAGAGIVCPWITRVENPEWYTLAREGAIYYPTLVSSLQEDGESNLSYSQVGAFAVSNNEEELQTIEQKARARKAETPAVGEVSRLSPEQARKLFPPLNESLSAVHVTGAARVDGRLLRDALQKAAEKHGAVRLSGNATLELVNDKVIGVNINGELVTADSVIFTSGAWTAELLSPLGIEVPIKPQRGQIAHLILPNEDTSKWPVVLPQGSHYIVAFDDSRVVVGATRETDSGFDYRLTAAGVKEVLDEAIAVAPGLADSTLQEVRIGFRPMGPDILPLIGSIPTIDGVIIATGLGASGLTMGPYVGCIAANLALGHELDLDLTPYYPLRESLKV